MRLVCATAALVCFAFAGFDAVADETSECVQAYEQAQVLQKASKLIEARAQMLTCAHVRCPEIVRNDCVQWLNALDAHLPSIVLGALGPDGHDAIAVQVWIDGRKVLDRLDGRALPMNPGPHRLRFVTAGAEPVDLEVLVREGEIRRPLTVRFPMAGAPAGPSRPVPAASYVLWGLGVVGLASFAALGLKGRAELDHMSETCKPNCPKDDEDAAWRKLAAADISGAIGLVALAAGTWIYFARPVKQTTGSTPSTTAVSLHGLPGGAWFGARVAF